MRHLRKTLPIICASIGSVCSAQTATDLNEGSIVTPSLTPDNYIFSWWGELDRFYVIEHSADLLSPWSHIPAIEPGYDEIAEWGFATNADKFFLRLKYTDDALTGAFYGDDDFDGIINGVEVLLGYSAITANGNTDGDLLTDRQELALGLDPDDTTDAVDGDNDGIVDAIERLYGLSISGTTDLDGDSMDDEWELTYYLDLTTDDSGLDADDDGRTNLQEFNDGTNPWAFDTDGDTIPDGIEVANNLDPKTADPIHTRNNYAWQFTTDLTDRFSEFSDRISQSSTHTLALDKDDNVYAWGSNTAGQLAQGTGTAGTDLAAPTLTQFNDSRSVAAGDATSHVVNLNGTAQAAGNNYLGVLGNGATPLVNPSIQETVVSVSNLTDVKRINAESDDVTEAISGSLNKLYAWGGLVGSNYGGPSYTGTPQGPLKSVQDLVWLSPTWGAGQLNAFGSLVQSGEVYMWGANFEHSLARSGAPTYTTTSSGKREINEVPDASYIAVKTDHSAALSELGSLWLWGKFNGLLWTAANEEQSTPTEVFVCEEGLRGIAIAHADDTKQEFLQKPGFVLDEDGKLWRFYRVISEEYTSTAEQLEAGELIIEQISYKDSFVGVTSAYDGIILLTASGELVHYSSSTESYNYTQVLVNNGNEYPSAQTAIKPATYGAFTKLDVPNFYDSLDSNSDGLSDLYERYIGLNPNSIDTNGDGVSDAAAITSNTSPTSWDNDGDTIPNAVEIVRGLNPNSTDSDGDGMLDNEEFYLYDRLSNYILTTDPNSQGPAINLISPAPGDITAL